ncbi:restriction endonuclease subunit S [Mesorhizobium sp. M0306]|uniref:restriction endonuclease subunit S n=1 Tax=Mesorhizobium sp. M0306 TaxID=2956932 RepID=UPI00333CDCC7
MVPEGWQRRTLGEVTELQRGFDLPASQREPGLYPIISSSGRSGTHSEPRVKGPGIVTGRYGSIGEVFYVEEDHWPLNTSLWVRDFHGNDKRFAYYFLQTVDFEKYSDKTSVPGVNRNDLHRISALVPPLAEQKKIADILSTWDAAIETNENLLANAEAQKRALMGQLLTGKRRLKGYEGSTWPDVELGQMGELISGLTYSPSDVVKDGQGLLVLRSSNVQGGSISLVDTVYVNLKLPENKLTRFGDVLICVRNGSRNLIGKAAKISKETTGVAHGAFMALFRPTEPEFAYQLICSAVFRRHVSQNLGATINSINGSDLRKFVFAYPPSAERNKISEILSTADDELQSLRRQLELLKVEKAALMRELLTGKRRVTV